MNEYVYFSMGSFQIVFLKNNIIKYILLPDLCIYVYNQPGKLFRGTILNIHSEYLIHLDRKASLTAYICPYQRNETDIFHASLV